MSNAKIKEMKVLNIAQPHAHNVIFNGKNVENRSKGSKFRGTIAIYASKTCKMERFEDQEVTRDECTFGAIIGFVDIVDCITEDEIDDKTREWFSGPYGYVFENVVVLKRPVSVTPPQGAVIWWPLSGKKLQDCLDQISVADIKPVEFCAPAKGVSKSKGKSLSGSRHSPSAELAKIIGSDPTSYKAAAKKVIDYIYKNGLVPKGTDTVVADRKLERVFGKKKIRFAEFKALILMNLEGA